MRYGTKQCSNDRLPADRLEQAVTRRLWKVLEDHDLLDQAINQAYERLTERANEQASEHTAIQRKLTETRASMAEDTCAPRIAALSEQIKALEDRAPN
jgi:flagellar motility protein MotE (MotC chaperone)